MARINLVRVNPIIASWKYGAVVALPSDVNSGVKVFGRH